MPADESSWLRAGLPHIDTVGESAHSDWHDARRLLYNHELLCFGADSDCQIGFADQRIHCGPGSWIIIPPATWHTCSGYIPTNSFRLWVHFDWQWQALPLDPPRICYHPAVPQEDAIRLAPDWVPTGILHGHCRDSVELRAAHARLRNRWQRGDLRAGASLMEVLHCCMEVGGGPQGCDDLLERCRLLLSDIAAQPFAEAPAIRGSMAALGQTYDHLARRFQAAFGLSPLAFVNAQRMERATALLSESDMSIGAIADLLGFRDQAYFSRLYKRVCGCRPQDLRR